MISVIMNAKCESQAWKAKVFNSSFRGFNWYGVLVTYDTHRSRMSEFDH